MFAKNQWYVAAWDHEVDRAPLSMGIKEGDNIRCRYHGLLVSSEGHALQMPVRSERTHKSVCTKAYPVAERHRFVWIWIGDVEKADTNFIPDFWPCSNPDWTFDGGYFPMKCDYRLVIDNLMDLTHETYWPTAWRQPTIPSCCSVRRPMQSRS